MNQIMSKVQKAMLCMTRQCWEQGIVAQALLELGESDALRLVIHDMIIRQSSDGRLCCVENTPAVTDSAFCAAPVLEEGLQTQEDALLIPAMKNIHFLLNTAKGAEDGTLYHMFGTCQIWADSAAFLPFSLTLAGFYKEAYAQMTGIARRLYDPKSGLYFHMWDEAQGTFLRPLPWASGNGWILTGLLRTILAWNEKAEAALPKAREHMIEMFQSLLDSILLYETPEHGFHDILTDPSSFQESASCAMVAYAIYRGVRQGMLVPSYQKRADAIRSRLLSKIAPSGLVADAAGSPSFDRPGTSAECQAHVLMMEKEYELLFPNVRIS